MARRPLLLAVAAAALLRPDEADARRLMPRPQPQPLAATPSAELEVAAGGAALGNASAAVLYSEDFGGFRSGDSWGGSGDLRVQTGSPNFLRVAYHPAANGSPRLQRSLPLRRAVRSATVSYGVWFEEGFQWVRGGKLGAGLCGGACTTGCNPVVANGWSARLMWRRNGELEMYIYDQGRCPAAQGRCCGRSVVAERNGQRLTMQRGRWYNLAYTVTMNSAPDRADGSAELRVDNQLMARATGLRWVARAGTSIETFFFSTFYGGNSREWAPTTTTHARYRNFRVVANG